MKAYAAAVATVLFGASAITAFAPSASITTRTNGGVAANTKYSSALGMADD